MYRHVVRPHDHARRHLQTAVAVVVGTETLRLLVHHVSWVVMNLREVIVGCRVNGPQRMKRMRRKMWVNWRIVDAAGSAAAGVAVVGTRNVEGIVAVRMMQGMWVMMRIGQSMIVVVGKIAARMRNALRMMMLRVIIPLRRVEGWVLKRGMLGGVRRVHMNRLTVVVVVRRGKTLNILRLL